MQTLDIKRILCFVFSTLFFATISFLFREILISNFNNVDLKLISIDYMKNYGAAFSLLHTHTTLLIGISVVILIFVLFYIIKNINEFSKIDLFFSSLLCSGIVCNFIERLTDGYVTDYIRINLFAFPIFNISDTFICIGAFVLICNILFSNDNKQD